MQISGVEVPDGTIAWQRCPACGRTWSITEHGVSKPCECGYPHPDVYVKPPDAS